MAHPRRRELESLLILKVCFEVSIFHPLLYQKKILRLREGHDLLKATQQVGGRAGTKPSSLDSAHSSNHPDTEYCLPRPCFRRVQVLPWLCRLYLVFWEFPTPASWPRSLLSGIPSCLVSIPEHWAEYTGPGQGPESQRVGDRGFSFWFWF